MEGIANMRVYYNGEIIPNTHEGVTFVCEYPFSFVIPCTMSFIELQNGLCENIQSHILKRVSSILYRNYVQVFGGLIQFQLMSITNDACMQRMFYIYQQTRFHVPMIELYVEFEQHTGMDAVGDNVNEEVNNDSEEEFEANYEVDDENDDGDLTGNLAVQNEAHAIVSQHPFGVSSFMWTLDLEYMHALKFSEYANIGESNVAANDDEFSVGMKFGSRESVISAIKSYTISRGCDYTGYGTGCDWLIRASLIRKKGCWEIKRYNGKYTCTMVMILQDHAKLDSDTIIDAIRTLVEADPSIKVKSIIAEVQSRFNYTVSYHKAWLAKRKSIAKIFDSASMIESNDCEDNKASCSNKMLPIYRESEEILGVRVLHCIFWSFYPCVEAFRYCKPLVQLRLHKNIVPITFAIVEGETADACEFFLTNLWRYVVIIDGVSIISDRHNSIDVAIACSNGA
ncbi:hypothetical protein Ahy_B10g102643 [Arachis hypogaea]|uniref:Transposase MuDR plant domain-containing protein n=1 Tax=Arachis hypogaea TaxID=3818 RepID=A0A444X2G4_ARAHY|nr:hypothetical protein Ahy_B10g102643 [Arachis hypogaea]